MYALARSWRRSCICRVFISSQYVGTIRATVLIPAQRSPYAEGLPTKQANNLWLGYELETRWILALF